MSILDDLECVAWKADTQFWQAIAGIKAARSQGVINNIDDCMGASQAGSAIAEEFGIPTVLGDSFGSWPTGLTRFRFLSGDDVLRRSRTPRRKTNRLLFPRASGVGRPFGSEKR